MDLADRVVLVSRADRAVGMAATGREVMSPVVPAGTIRAAPADTADTGLGARANLEALADLRGNLVGPGGRAVPVNPVVLAGTIRADPAVTNLGARGRTAQVLNLGRALLDPTPTVPDRAHLDRTPAVPDLMPAHPDRMRPAGRGPTRHRRVATAQAAALALAEPIRPAGRTPQAGAILPVGATLPAEVTDLRSELLLVTVAVIPRPLPVRVLTGRNASVRRCHRSKTVAPLAV